jgi:3-oxoacyl-(acyl-carrier-protein) synthase
MGSLEHAIKRGALVIVEYLDGTITCDAYDMTDPLSHGLGVSMCHMTDPLSDGPGVFKKKWWH